MPDSISTLGNGTGFLFVTPASENGIGAQVLHSFPNDDAGKRQLYLLATEGHIIPERYSLNHGDAWSENSYDPDTGYRFYLDLAAVAARYELTGAETEISKYILNPGINGKWGWQETAIVAGVATFTRERAITYLILDGEAAAADDLVTLTVTGRVKGDLVVIAIENESHAITIKNTGNILLRESLDAVLNKFGKTITLIWDSFTEKWTEVFRNIAPAPNFETLRLEGIPFPKPGVLTLVLDDAGGTINLDPDNDEGIVEVIGDGAPVVLTSNWTITGGGTPITGDKFYVNLQGSIDLNGNTLTIFGYSVPSGLALDGEILVMGYYDGAGWVGIPMPQMTARFVQGSNIVLQTITQSHLANASVGAAQIIDGSVGPDAIDVGYELDGFIALIIDDPDVLTLNSAPIELIPAPGANKIIELVHAVIFIDFVTTPYATNLELQLITNTASVPQLKLANALNASGDSWRKLLPKEITDAGDSMMAVNQPVNVTVANGDPTAGDSPVYVFAWYKTIELS